MCKCKLEQLVKLPFNSYQTLPQFHTQSSTGSLIFDIIQAFGEHFTFCQIQNEILSVILSDFFKNLPPLSSLDWKLVGTWNLW